MFSVHARWCSVLPIQGGAEFSCQQTISSVELLRKSSDLNPIGNLWSMMNRKVGEKQPFSTVALQQAINKVWVKKFDEENCRKAITACACLKKLKVS